MKLAPSQTFQRLMSWRRAFSNTKLGFSGLQIVLWALGISSLVYCLAGYSVSAWHQAQQKAIFSELTSSRDLRRDATARGSNASSGGGRAIVPKPAPGGLIGVIEIPRLKISSVVDEGVDNKTLLVAVGHVPGTAFPGENGNVALAAHRDTFFRELGQLHTGDEITLTTLQGAYHYNVESTRIVSPSAKEVLQQEGQPILTLITCYPFHYVGPAPKRFVVVASQTASSTR